MHPAVIFKIYTRFQQINTFSSDLQSSVISKMSTRWQQKVFPSHVHCVILKMPTRWQQRAFSCLKGSVLSALK